MGIADAAWQAEIGAGVGDVSYTAWDSIDTAEPARVAMSDNGSAALYRLLDGRHCYYRSTPGTNGKSWRVGTTAQDDSARRMGDHRRLGLPAHFDGAGAGEPVIDLYQYAGTPTDPAYDFTAALAAAQAASQCVFLPVRVDGNGDPIPYKVTAASLPAANGRIVCESPDVEVEAATANDWIFDLSGAVRRLTVEGGTWGRNSAGVLRHAAGSGSLESCTFRGLWVRGPGGFDVGSCAAVTWRDCIFQNINVGVKFNPTGAGFTNANWIERCTFYDCAIGVHFAGQLAKVGNWISRCWFEAPSIIASHAIRSDGYTLGLGVTGSYFEQTSDAGADIHLQDDGPTTSIDARIRDNTFALPKPGQDCRIRNVGRATYIAADNRATIRQKTGGGHQVFASCEGASSVRDYRVWLKRNLVGYLSAADKPADYTAAVRSIAQVANVQTVVVEDHPASAGFAA